MDRNGAFIGKYRKAHIPHAAPGFWEKYYFRPGNLGFPGLRPRLLQGSASISATTVTSPRARASWA